MQDIAPVFVILSLCALVFGIFYIRNRENMALIERGINPRINVSKGRPFMTLKLGMLLIGSGLGLLAAFLIDMNLPHTRVLLGEGMSYERDYPQIYFALIGIGGGLGLVISYMIEKKWLDQDKRSTQED